MCSVCTPEVSSKESEDAAYDDCLSTGTQDTQNILDALISWKSIC